MSDWRVSGRLGNGWNILAIVEDCNRIEYFEIGKVYLGRKAMVEKTLWGVEKEGLSLDKRCDFCCARKTSHRENTNAHRTESYSSATSRLRGIMVFEICA